MKRIHALHNKKLNKHICDLCGMLMLLIISLSLGCRPKKTGILAEVNGEEILKTDFVEFYNSRPRIADWSSREGILDPDQVLDALIDKVLMEQKAKDMGLDLSPGYKDQLKKFEDKVLVNIFIQKWFDPKVHITDKEVEEVTPGYQKKEVRFARIVVLDEDKAWDIKKRLDKGEDFSQLARLLSIGMEAQNGGVGNFLSPHRGIYPKKVIEEIFHLPMGQISTPQKIREGFALFKPIEERKVDPAEMEQVLRYQRSLIFRERKNKLIRELLKKAKNERNILIHKEAVRKITSSKGSTEPQFFNPILAEGEGIQIQWKDLKENLPRSGIQGKGIWEDPNLLSKVLELRINKHLMVLEAQRLGFEKDPDLKKELTRFEQDLLSRQLMTHEVERKLVLTDADCRKYYQENLTQFAEPEMVHASHILIRDKEQAKEVLSKLKHGEDFAPLAERYSEYKVTSGKGGDMGYIKWGESGMGDEFERVAFTLKPGEMSELVETPFGYQIIKVTDRKPARTQPYEEVRNRIRQEMFNQKRKEAFDAYLKSLRSKAKIKIDQDLFRQLRQDFMGKKT